MGCCSTPTPRCIAPGSWAAPGVRCSIRWHPSQRRLELQLETDFEAALERGEFLLYDQPIVSLTSNKIVGFEALVRWQHPVLGLVPPLDFIPIAEKTGFIVPLGRWVVREACAQLKTWQTSIPHATWWTGRSKRCTTPPLRRAIWCWN
jgi:sensor c-di-GMP phosphodiesterase-like protein